MTFRAPPVLRYLNICHPGIWYNYDTNMQLLHQWIDPSYQVTYSHCLCNYKFTPLFGCIIYIDIRFQNPYIRLDSTFDVGYTLSFSTIMFVSSCNTTDKPFSCIWLEILKMDIFPKSCHFFSTSTAVFEHFWR